MHRKRTANPTLRSFPKGDGPLTVFFQDEWYLANLPSRTGIMNKDREAELACWVEVNHVLEASSGSAEGERQSVPDCECPGCPWKEFGLDPFSQCFSR